MGWRWRNSEKFSLSARSIVEHHLPRKEIKSGPKVRCLSYNIRTSKMSLSSLSHQSLSTRLESLIFIIITVIFLLIYGRKYEDQVLPCLLRASTAPSERERRPLLNLLTRVGNKLWSEKTLGGFWVCKKRFMRWSL